jgi:hypothetical protein
VPHRGSDLAINWIGIALISLPGKLLSGAADVVTPLQRDVGLKIAWTAVVEGEGQTLLAAIETYTHTGLRDRALLGVLSYTSARIGAVVNLKVEDYYPTENGSCSGLKRKRQRKRASRAPQARRIPQSDRSCRRVRFSLFQRLGQNRQVIAPVAGAHGRLEHAQTTAETSRIAGALFASLFPGDRHPLYERFIATARCNLIGS